MRNLKNLVVGIVLGTVATATLAWALEVRIPPRITAKANPVVDEMGNALFGAMPGKVEVTNLPASSQVGSGVVKDTNGVVVGAVSLIASQKKASIPSTIGPLESVGSTDSSPTRRVPGALADTHRAPGGARRTGCQH
jgi:hypothetical protein